MIITDMERSSTSLQYMTGKRGSLHYNACGVIQVFLLEKKMYVQKKA